MVMTNLTYITDSVIPAALKMLPGEMQSSGASAMLIAIGLQESQLKFRKQTLGPASGFWEFEEGGIRGVNNHWATKKIIPDILVSMNYNPTSIQMIKSAIEDNDILGCIYARLLLWTHPATLPTQNETAKAWRYYTDLWRPGKPHMETWPSNFAKGWTLQF